MPCDAGPSCHSINVDITHYVEQYIEENNDNIKKNNILKQQIDKLTELLCLACSKLDSSLLHENTSLLGWYADHLKRVDSYADELERRLKAVSEIERLRL